ncbi:hypothetical protein F4810DRAFT_644730 [Camillea tinctor]|nr:hypothetical protein F4810DRAFT_644730 [Camillea tinctor]
MKVCNGAYKFSRTGTYYLSDWICTFIFTPLLVSCQADNFVRKQINATTLGTIQLLGRFGLYLHSILSASRVFPGQGSFFLLLLYRKIDRILLVITYRYILTYISVTSRYHPASLIYTSS